MTGIYGEVPSGIRNGTLRGISAGTPAGIANGAPKRFSGTIFRQISDGNPAGNRGEISNRIIGGTLNLRNSRWVSYRKLPMNLLETLSVELFEE